MRRLTRIDATLRTTGLLMLSLLLAGWTGPRASRGAQQQRQSTQILFDDFNYSRHEEMLKRGWIIRTAPGWPGVPGAVWKQENVSFLKDPALPGNRLLRMTSSTDGMPARTTQTQICHQRKYLEGTYAARVRFGDGPAAGPDGDKIVETFYMISPLKAPMDEDYSELDFEYLPNGGWGKEGPTFFATTWETFSPEPNWKMDNQSGSRAGSRDGWRTLVLQVTGGEVKYFVDGEVLAEHGGRFYPESMMSINFNLWFIRDGLLKASDLRSYSEDVDWVYYERGARLTPAEVESRVRAMRSDSVRFRDTVKAPVPALATPCDF